jgi:hypothetical protein
LVASSSTPTNPFAPCAALATLCDISSVALSLLLQRQGNGRGIAVNLAHAFGFAANCVGGDTGRALHGQAFINS